MAILKIDAGCNASFGGVEYKPDANGLIEIPDEFAGEAASHGEIVHAIRDIQSPAESDAEEQPSESTDKPRRGRRAAV